ncbi:major facilitator superfamily domain-containing protein [Aspergillus aurantiobrunneus]
MAEPKPSTNYIESVADERAVMGPSDLKGTEDPDPNDPQNWSTRSKLTTYLTICFYTFLANVNSSNFTVATTAVIREFHVSQTQAGELVCFNVFLFGLGNIIWVPLMRVVGKRPVYLLSMVSLCMMNVWSSRASSYGELLASRILSGFAAAAADATVPAVVSDMVAPQERGHYLMVFHLALTSGLFIGPLINAYLVQEKNWRWMCYFLAIAVGAVCFVAIFTVRETTYLRAQPRTAKRTPWQWMSLTLGYNPQASFVRTLLDIICNVGYPQLLWASFSISISVGWNIVLQLTASRTFTAPPYNWPAGSLGLLSLSGFIGSVLAFYLGGRLIDIISTRYTNRHGGHRLPEYRLPAIVIPGIIGPGGILIFGLCIANQSHWVGAAFGYAMQAFGVAAISNVAVTYCLDCYKPLTGEALVIIFVVRNTIGMLLSLYAADWISRQGPAAVFGEMTAIQVASMLVAIPLFLWGGPLRSWTSRYGPMKRFAGLGES